MKNKRKNFCKPKVGTPNQYLCTANYHYECSHFSKGAVFMSECVHFAMGRCISIEAKRDAKRDADKGAL